MSVKDISKIADNRKARFEYSIGDTIEAGIVLYGTEVKSLRQGKANIKDSYAVHKENEIWLMNSYIGEYNQANRFNHTPIRPRKLLLHKTEIKKLIGKLKTQGITLVPLKMYFNERGIAKLQLAIAEGKKKHEKRAAIKERDWKREQGRVMKGDRE